MHLLVWRVRSARGQKGLIRFRYDLLNFGKRTSTYTCDYQKRSAWMINIVAKTLTSQLYYMLYI